MPCLALPCPALPCSALPCPFLLWYAWLYLLIMAWFSLCVVIGPRSSPEWFSPHFLDVMTQDLDQEVGQQFSKATSHRRTDFRWGKGILIEALRSTRAEKKIKQLHNQVFFLILCNKSLGFFHVSYLGYSCVMWFMFHVFMIFYVFHDFFLFPSPSFLPNDIV